jgi:hypothetical protein
VRGGTQRAKIIEAMSRGEWTGAYDACQIANSHTGETRFGEAGTPSLWCECIHVRRWLMDADAMSFNVFAICFAAFSLGFSLGNLFGKLVPALMLLASSAHAATIEELNARVNREHPYAAYAAGDFRVLGPGEPGNCAAIARTKVAELAKVGIIGVAMMCRLKTGEGHAFVQVEGQRFLDNRSDRPILYADLGCK